MLRALLIWLCFTEILKKTGSSSRSAWSPWHFSENLDQLGTWYIYIYLVSIRSIFANFLQLKSDQKSDQIESILQLWNEHDGSPHTRTHTYISEDNDAFFSKNEPCFFSSWFESTHFAGHLQYVHPMITVPFLSTTPEVTGASWCKGAEVPREWWKIHLLVHFWW